jgi:hypothetical protein
MGVAMGRIGICLGNWVSVVTHVKWTIVAVGVLGVLDAITTLVGVQRGVFFEVNPVLRGALDHHPGWFLLVKGGLTIFWMGVMLREIRRRWLSFLNLGVAVGYSLVVLRSSWYLLP